MHVEIANWRFPLKLVAEKTFPAFPARAQPSILRIWQEAYGILSNISFQLIYCQSWLVIMLPCNINAPFLCTIVLSSSIDTCALCRGLSWLFCTYATGFDNWCQETGFYILMAYPDIQCQETAHWILPAYPDNQCHEPSCYIILAHLGNQCDKTACYILLAYPDNQCQKARCYIWLAYPDNLMARTCMLHITGSSSKLMS